MTLQELLSWLSNLYTTVITTVAQRIETFYTLITHSERAGVAFLAGIFIVYSTVAFTVLFDEALQAYRRMPK